MQKITLPRDERLRCPCCGETFVLADALPREEPSTASAASGPERLPITLIFDGGSIGNPGRGYGSYRLTVGGKQAKPKRLEFGGDYTNNEAEYDTLIAALEEVVRRAKDPRRVTLDIRGDSQLVINQVNGTWKTRDARMAERKERVMALLGQLGSWTATWHARDKSVDALGH